MGQVAPNLAGLIGEQ
ncbi:unnamed protein product, partial [Rotaria magnacalcarata]